MYIDSSSLFHAESKDLRDKGRANIPADSNLWPAEWKTVYYKTYPRLSKIALTPPRALRAEYAKLLHSRRSRRDFKEKKTEKNTLSQLLAYSCGIVEGKGEFPNRMYPSGGARFPIEIYPLIFSGSSEVPAGVYHYDVKNHALDVLWKRPFSKEDIGDLFVYDWIQSASFALIMTATFWRTQMKYGQRGYRYALIEAGHISENVYLTSGAVGIGCCAMGGMQDERIERLLDIDGITESVVHSLILG